MRPTRPGVFLLALVLGWQGVVNGGGPARAGDPTPQGIGLTPLAQQPLREEPEIPSDVRGWGEQGKAALRKGEREEALRLQQRVVQWAEQRLGPLHPYRAEALADLAVFLSAAGRQSEALPVFQQALGIYRNIAKVDRTYQKSLARALKNLATIYRLLDQRKNAMPLMQEAILMYRELLAEQPALKEDLADLLDMQGADYSRLQQRQEALVASREAVRLRRQLVDLNAANQSDLAISLANLAIRLREFGRLQEAIDSLAEGVTIFRGFARTDSAHLRNLAKALMMQVDYLEQAGRWQDALNPLEELATLHGQRARTDPRQIYPYALARMKSGLALRQLAKPEPARLADEDAVDALRKIPNPSQEEQALLATTLMNLGVIYNELGLLNQALSVSKEALDLNRFLAAKDPQRSDNLASSLINYGYALSELGRIQDALPPSLEGVDLRRRLGENNQEAKALLARDLHNLGTIQSRLNRKQEALLSMEEAVRLRQGLAQSNSLYRSDLSRSLRGISALYVDQRRYREALFASKQAVAINRELSRASQFYLRDLSRDLISLGAVQLERNQRWAAQASLAESVQILRTLAKGNPGHLRDLAVALNALVSIVLSGGDQAQGLSLIEERLATEFTFFQTQLPVLPEGRRQSLVAQFGIHWQQPFSLATHSAAAANLALKTRLNRHGLLQQIERRQALLSRAGGAPRQLVEQLTALTSQLANASLPPLERQRASIERERLEQEIYRLLPQIRLPLVQPLQVAQRLPADGVLVEFQRYVPYDPASPAEYRWGDARYLALVLLPSGSVQALDLGEARALEPQIARALSLTTAQAPEASAAWSALGQRLFSPLQSVLAGRRRWLLSPDGALHQVPFAALPVLSGAVAWLPPGAGLQTISSGRDLLPTGPAAAAAKANGPLVLAAPSFRNWPPLPGTAQEGEGVAAELGTRPLLGASATVAALERSRSPRLIHIASHAHFDEDALDGEGKGDPLLASFLVLAGADGTLWPSRQARSTPSQASSSPRDDGYLTAREAARLQLEGTELVVLSACDTGRGGYLSGDGLYGLQRGFTVAGARGTLVSLWKVPDAATRHFMERFHAELRTTRHATRALQVVQEEFRLRPQVAGWSHPYFWAAWQYSCLAEVSP